MPRSGTRSARSMSPRARSSSAIDARAGRPAARAAGRHRHRHRPDDRAVRPARRSGDRHRPVVRKCCGWRGSSWRPRADRRRAAPGRHVRAAAGRRQRRQRASSTRCCITPSRPPRRSPRRRACSRPAGACWSSISPRTSARNCATSDAHVRLGFADEAMRGWFDAAGLAADHVEHLEGGELTVTLWRGVKRRRPSSSGRPHEPRSTSRRSRDCTPLFAEARGDIACQLRILPAQDREDGGDAVGVDQDAGAARSRASSRSPTAPAARPASAPTRRSSGSSRETAARRRPRT